MGLGYIGLPTASLLATSGYRVAGVDVNEEAVGIINQGKIHIVEPDLDAFVRAAVVSGNLKAYLEPQDADIFMICVPTPFKSNGNIPKPDLDYVESAARAIAPCIKPGNLVILESTSPVGTTERVCDVLKSEGVVIDEISIAYCPERVLPGRIMVELLENDRIVGGIDEKSTESVSAFYRTFVKGSVLETNAKTAEMSKLVENSYRDVNIAFANELSMLCEQDGIDVSDVIALANRHPRVNILQPGCGVGGHCISVDPWFIVSGNPEQAQLIRKAREVNDYKAEWSAEKIKSIALQFELDNGRKPVVACMGLAYKPDIDDLRESPALKITRNLIREGLNVMPVEPNLSSHKDLQLVTTEQAIDEADILVFMVKHREFIEIDVQGKQVIDFCGMNA